MFCPPMNRLFETPRQSMIDDIAAKYPEQKKKKGALPSLLATDMSMKSISDGISSMGKATKNAVMQSKSKKDWF